MVDDKQHVQEQTDDEVEPRTSLASLSNIEAASDRPPDGGSYAWLQCAAAFCVWVNSWGLANAFGAFQTYYEDQGLRSKSSSQISWIGSLQIAIFMFGAFFLGRAFDNGYLKTMLVSGGFLIVFGMMMTSLCTEYWQFILAQGVCVGAGMIFLFMPSIAVLPMYFARRRALAMGIATAGTNIGAIIFLAAFEQLLPQVGFGWTTRIMAFIVLALQVLPILVLRKRITSTPKRALLDTTALKEPAFVIVMVHMTIAYAGFFIPFYYIEVFAESQPAIASQAAYLSKYLIIVISASSLPARVIMAWPADRVGPLNMITLNSLLMAAVAFSWAAVTTKTGLICFCVFYGFCTGAYVALVPTVWASLSPDLKVLGTRTGMMTIPMAIGFLVGPPIAGALTHGDDFRDAQMFCGACFVVAGMLLLAARVAKTRRLIARV